MSFNRAAIAGALLVFFSADANAVLLTSGNPLTFEVDISTRTGNNFQQWRFGGSFSPDPNDPLKLGVGNSILVDFGSTIGGDDIGSLLFTNPFSTPISNVATASGLPAPISAPIDTLFVTHTFVDDEVDIDFIDIQLGTDVFRSTTIVIDTDDDGIPDSSDNAPNIPNPGQEDQDGDGVGDVADEDIDGDGVVNGEDPDPFNPGAVGLPTADAGGPYVIDLGLDSILSLDASGSFSPNFGGPSAFSWNIGGLSFLDDDPFLDIPVGDLSSLGTGNFDVTLDFVDPAGFGDNDQTTLSISQAQTGTVPEPGSIALFGIGLGGLALARRRRKAA